jgi:hypothetical protein
MDRAWSTRKRGFSTHLASVAPGRSVPGSKALGNGQLFPPFLASVAPGRSVPGSKALGNGQLFPPFLAAGLAGTWRTWEVNRGPANR